MWVGQACLLSSNLARCLRWHALRSEWPFIIIAVAVAVAATQAWWHRQGEAHMDMAVSVTWHGCAEGESMKGVVERFRVWPWLIGGVGVTGGWVEISY